MKNLTVMLTDMIGFTDRTAHQSRAELLEMLQKHKELVLPIILESKGKLIKTIGDAFLVTFESPTDAVLCGISIQECLENYNKDKSQEDKIKVRIAINSGEVTLADNDIFGEAVNITARIESIAEAGEVFFTEAVYLAMNKQEVPSSEVGYRQFKGVPEKIKVYKVLRERPVEDDVSDKVANAIPDTEQAREQEPSSQTPGPRPTATDTPSADTTDYPSFLRRAGGFIIDVAIFVIALSVLNNFFYPDRYRHDNTDIRDINVDIDMGDGRKQIISKSAKAGKKTMRKTIKTIVTAKKASEGKSDAPARAQQDKETAMISIDKEKGVKVKFGDIVDIDIPASELRDHRDMEKSGYRSNRDAMERRGQRRHNKPKLPTAVFWVLYQVIFLRLRSATPGKMLMRMKVVKYPDRTRLGIREMLIRACVSVISGIVFAIGYFWAIKQKDKRCWHDLMAETVVVYAK
ncbi:adenylate/guanylate cyclase domain-containing protein [Elusimicrobiota bacterium]